jgi:hypothetical protein
MAVEDVSSAHSRAQMAPAGAAMGRIARNIPAFQNPPSSRTPSK